MRLLGYYILYLKKEALNKFKENTSKRLLIKEEERLNKPKEEKVSVEEKKPWYKFW